MTYDEYMAPTGSVTPIVDTSSWRYIQTQEDEEKFAEAYQHQHIDPDHLQLDMDTVLYQVSNNIQQPTKPITKHKALTGDPIVPRKLDDQRDHPAPSPIDPSGNYPTWDVI